MGDIKDIEDYKHKIEKQAKFRRKTIKAIKEHFRLEDVPLIETNLKDKTEVIEEVVVQNYEQKEQKILPKIKTSINARPIFTSNFERYEWHQQNGCIGNEDRIWLENYLKSDEYKEIYS